MTIPFHIHPKVRIALARVGSLILMFQKAPLVRLILPEARIAGFTGANELVKWSVATVAGLGVFDSVAGATTLTQLAPSPGSLTVPATAGNKLSFTVQLTGTPYANTIDYWTTTGTLPSGLTGLENPTDSTIYTISGTPTQTGSFPITIRIVGHSRDSYSKSFTINVSPATVAPPTITGQPSSVTIPSGTRATLNVTATGTNLTYQWFKGKTGATTYPIKGAIYPKYRTPSLTSSKKYWVRVKNSAGKVNSKTATVYISP